MPVKTKTSSKNRIAGAGATKRAARETKPAAHSSSNGKKGRQQGSSDHALRDVLGMELQLLHDAERQMLKVLPKLANKASDETLRNMLQFYERSSDAHVARLEQALEMLEGKWQKVASGTARGLVEDAEWRAKNIKGSAALDAGIVAAARALGHYKITEYGAAHEWAALLGLQEMTGIFEEILREEEEVSDQLLDLALTDINERAVGDREEGREGASVAGTTTKGKPAQGIIEEGAVYVAASEDADESDSDDDDDEEELDDDDEEEEGEG